MHNRLRRIWIILAAVYMPALASAQEDMLQQVRAIVEQEGIDFYIDAVVELSQAEYPKKMDALDTVTGIHYVRATRALTYRHLLSRDWQEQVANASEATLADVIDFMPRMMQDQAVARACSVPLNRLYFEYGVKLVGIYADYTGAIVFTTTVTGENCSKGRQ